MTLDIADIIAEGEAVAVRFIERGRSVKPFRDGPPATSRTYEITAMEWFEIKNGKIHRPWGARDSATIMRQMGLNPS
jgi:predicted ester cyclase